MKQIQTLSPLENLNSEIRKRVLFVVVSTPVVIYVSGLLIWSYLDPETFNWSLAVSPVFIAIVFMIYIVFATVFLTNVVRTHG